MIKNAETREQGSSSFDDDVIRCFLHGELNPEQQSTFERRLLVDDDLDARVRVQEISIIDDYVAGKLPRSVARRFPDRFLVTKERTRAVAVAQALRDRFYFTREAEIDRSKARIFNFKHVAWRYAFAAVLLIVVFATVRLGVKERRVAGPIVIPKRPQAKPTATQSPVVAHHPTSPSAPTHSQESSPLPEHETMLVMTLSLTNTVSHPYELKLGAAQAKSLRVIVNVEKNRSGSYRAELWNSRGESLFSAYGLTQDDHGRLIMDMPARDLPNGEYLIRLQPDEAESPAFNYYFRTNN